MKIIASVFVLFVAALHSGFLVLEMFYWDHEIGRRIFNLTPEISSGSKVLAMNQGLYNGFLSAGLLWGLGRNRFDVTMFFLLCVIVAGVFGALTVKPSIFIVQAVPALVAVVFVWLSRNKFA